MLAPRDRMQAVDDLGYLAMRGSGLAAVSPGFVAGEKAVEPAEQLVAVASLAGHYAA